MHLNSVKGYSPLGQFGILLGFLLLGFILSVIIQFAIGISMMPEGTPIASFEKELMKAMMNPNNLTLTRLMQVLGTFGLLFIPSVLFCWVTYGKNMFWLGFNKYINVYQVLIGFALIFAANVMASPIAEFTKDVVANYPALDKLAKQLEDTYNEQVLLMTNLRNWQEYLMAIVIMAFFPALFEEIFFRGALQNVLVRWLQAPMTAIIITSLLFSFIHFSIYLFISRAILGFVLGLMYHKSRNIWVNVIAHFINNAIAVTQLYLLSRKNEKIDVAKLDPPIEWWVGLLAFGGVVLLFILLKRVSIFNKQKIETKEALLYAQGNNHDPFNNPSISGTR